MKIGTAEAENLYAASTIKKRTVKICSTLFYKSPAKTIVPLFVQHAKSSEVQRPIMLKNGYKPTRSSQFMQRLLLCQVVSVVCGNE